MPQSQQMQVFIVLLVLFNIAIIIGPRVHDQFNINVLGVLRTTAQDDDSTVPPDLHHLEAVCKSTTWKPGLWLSCQAECGPNSTSFCMGLNNARSRIQTCLRMAIDAGAGAIIPHIAARDPNHLENVHTQVEYCPSIWWDTERLQDIMGKHCPQLELRFCPDDYAALSGGAINTVVVSAPHRPPITEPWFVTGTVREMARKALSDHAQTTLDEVDQAHPAVVEFSDPFIAWNYRSSNELLTARRDLFRALDFNKTLLHLSDAILDSYQLNSGHFIGVHLRGEADWPANMGTVEDQMRLYAEAMEGIRAEDFGRPIKTVFVSSGSREAIQRFKNILEPMDYTVHDKWSLLAERPDEAAQVARLRFDQMAVSEYQVLIGAKVFMGYVESLFSDSGRPALV